MKRSLVFALLFGLAGFVAGTVCAAYLAHQLETHLRDDVRSYTTDIHFQAEQQVSFAVYTIRSVNEERVDKVVRMQCHIARISLPLVRTDIYRSEEKKQEVIELQKEAEKTVALLQKEGRC